MNASAPTPVTSAEDVLGVGRALGVLDDPPRMAARATELVHALFPICRSITGNGVRETLAHVARYIPLVNHEVPSGTPVLDWEVPREWNVRDAYIADMSGRRVVDFNANNLHLMSYSVPVRARMTLDALRAHLFTRPDQPDWIPYRTSYWREAWGFCLSQRQLDTLPEGEYDVVVDTTLEPGHLTYGECVIRGRSAQEVLIFTHVCHPSLCNDNASGIAAAAVLVQEIARQTPHLTYRFVFAPGTIGAITWIARNADVLPRVRAGLSIGSLADSGPLTFKRSRRGDTEIDAISAAVVRSLDEHARIEDFSPYGYDERQFCSPGVDLAFGRLSRSGHDAFAQYHTSADNLDLLDPDAYAQSLDALMRIFATLDGNRRLRNLAPVGEPRLGKRGLFRSTGGTSPGEFEHALLWVLNQSDGTHGVADIAAKSGLPRASIEAAARALIAAGLVAPIDEDHDMPQQEIQG
ncbi:MAG TPA: DUF4910 domain-containing protein [Burkholderiaceae bacterium]|nr:DUF4910 domain-containing protein [Burkholderiaceae bacterium]